MFARVRVLQTGALELRETTGHRWETTGGKSGPWLDWEFSQHLEWFPGLRKGRIERQDVHTERATSNRSEGHLPGASAPLGAGRVRGTQKALWMPGGGRGSERGGREK